MSEQQPASSQENVKGGPRRGKRRDLSGKGGKGTRDVAKMMAVAREKFDDGRLKPAIDMLKRILSTDRSNPAAMALLGLCYMRRQRFAEGEKLMKRALDAAPMNVEVQVTYAKLLHGLGQRDQAANVFSRALQLDPQNGSTYCELAILLIDAGVLDQATEALIMAVRLNPQDAKAFYHLGLVKKMQNRPAEAIEAYSMAVAIRPDYAEAHINLAKIAIDNKKYELGEKSCLNAIKANPNLAAPYSNLCMVKRAQGDPEEAVRYGKKGVELDPMSGPAYSNLGNAYMDLHRYQEAQACFRKAIEFQPSFATAYYNYGNSLRLLHVLGKALVAYDKAIELQPDSGEFHNNRALVYQEQGREADALAGFRQAVALSNGNPELRFGLARSLWRNGLLEEFWDHFDAGLGTYLRKPNRKFQQPRWRGENISDKRILVWREQGLGDEIDFSRRFPNIIEAAGETIIEADKRLVALFERSFPGARFLPERLDDEADWARNDCDLHLPAGNLLQYFPFNEEELALAQYPEDDIEAAFACGERSKNAKGYMVPDPERVAEMAERVAQLPEGFKVGICWRSSYSHRDRDIHYARLEMWEPIFRIPGLVLVNLFYDECEEEVTAVEERYGVKIHRWPDIDLRNDLEAAFALTTQMDLVMSTSSSPSRIAEAVGREVWMMSAAASCLKQPPKGEYGVPHHIHWQRHWTESWSVLMERMARALEARLKAR